jgi:hypothetical protein
MRHTEGGAVRGKTLWEAASDCFLSICLLCSYRIARASRGARIRTDYQGTWVAAYGRASQKALSRSQGDR